MPKTIRSISLAATDLTDLAKNIQRKLTSSPSKGPAMTQKDKMALTGNATSSNLPTIATPGKPRIDNKKSASKVIQVIGADTSKTMFTPSEFSAMQKSLCREGQPLVLVRDRKAAGSTESFILGAKQMKRFNQGKVTLQDILSLDAYLFHERNTSHPARVSLASLYEHDEDIALIDALLGVNGAREPKIGIYSRQCMIAAMLLSKTLGFTDTGMGTKVMKSVPQKFQKDALDAALVTCAGEKGATLGQHLLEWGASPDAVDTDDEVSVLGSAIRRFDEPMIRLLLNHGADAHKETDTDVTAAELVKIEPYVRLSWLFSELLAKSPSG